ncbi:MAG: metallophosphoesterase [Bacteroidetes bacterium]|jgi:3',5'-cyclic-AMP phosphodiesterase|nr:metallophosphoesterase [Bacteroidota bacterium]MBT4409840.1 metallophosphoesterase [Bacteroidota bacterium]MBT7094522.1 metallophosphoesterase [Bacteroidota bacterium]
MKKSTLLLLVLIFISSGLTLQAQKTDESCFKFVFLTDIHVQPEEMATEGFQQAIAKVNEINPDFVITGGDLIMDALNQTKERADSLYLLYLSLQKQFNMPVYNTPGNHENYGFQNIENVERTDPDYGINMFRRYLGKPYYSFDHQGWHFIVLNSVAETEERGYRGDISQEQIEWLQKDLNGIDDSTPIVISVHIPFISVMRQRMYGALEPNLEGGVINNSREVLRLFNGKNLKLALQGHLHYLEDIYIEGKTHFITGGAVSANWWRGPRYGMEEGFLVLSVKGEDFSWEYVDFGWEVEK